MMLASLSDEHSAEIPARELVDLSLNARRGRPLD